MVLSGTIIFESVPGSPSDTYCFCKDSEPFKVPKSSMESLWVLLTSLIIRCLRSDRSGVTRGTGEKIREPNPVRLVERREVHLDL